MAPPSLSTGKAITIGHLLLNVPAVLILSGFSFLAYKAIIGSSDGENSDWAWVIPVLSGVAISWLWWSILVPRWYVWACERVKDIDELNKLAVETSLIWPEGSILNRTQLWTKKLRDRMDNTKVDKEQD